MGNTVKERTLEFIKYKKISVKEFEIRCGLSNGYVASMRKGFGADKLSNVLSAYPELNREWLLFNEGEMTASPPTEPPPEDADTILIPVRNLDSRGGFDFNEEVGTPTYTTGYLPFPTSIARQGDVVIPIYGDSMEPTYKAGSMVLIREVELWREYLELGCTYVIGLVDDRRVIKTVMAGSDADNFLLVSINPSFQPQEISKDIIRSVWRVIASVRREAL
jgi:phage repressor protein C with HTH and peptisase S24 domain